MNPRVVTVLKWLFVAAMMYYVSTLITLEDRLVTRRDQQVVAAEVVEIVGDWRADPIRFRLDGVEQSEQASRVLPDGRVLEVQPGFVSYLRSLDVGWFALGVGCYILTVMLAGARWWWRS